MMILWKADFEGDRDELDRVDDKLRELEDKHGYGVQGPLLPQDAVLLYVFEGTVEQADIPLTPLEYEVAWTPEEFWGEQPAVALPPRGRGGHVPGDRNVHGARPPCVPGGSIVEALQVVFTSGMDFDEMWDVCEERMPRFRKVPGLVQKVYLRDDETEEISGLYLFEDTDSLEAFLASDLRETIADAYDVQGTPEVRRWTVPGTLFPLGSEPVVEGETVE